MPGFVRTFCISISLATAVFASSYAVDGLVIAVARETFKVAHRPIPGRMQAMTMDFHVDKPAELTGLRPGMRVKFEANDGRASRIRILKPDEADIPVVLAAPQIGQIAPDFTLIDHHGQTTRLADFRGKVVAINFLYTRCPMPDVCPRLAASFASLHRRFQTGDLQLFSITIDPQWDTPQVLAAYAKLWRTRDDGWRFLTGAPDVVKQAATAWGLVYWPEEGAIVHTSRTAVIDRSGRVAAMVEGSAYRTDQLIQLIAHELKEAK